jgi:hypothetical protein
MVFMKELLKTGNIFIDFFGYFLIIIFFQYFDNQLVNGYIHGLINMWARSMSKLFRSTS